MNDTMSLVLATAILTVGGLGLYMYKSPQEDYNEDNLFGSKSFWGATNDDEEKVEVEAEIEDEDNKEYYKPKPRGIKTKRRRSSVGTKRRYY